MFVRLVLVEPVPRTALLLRALVEEGSGELIVLTSPEEMGLLGPGRLVHLALVDEELPDAELACARLRRRFPEVELLVLGTAASDASAVLRAVRWGARDYLRNPAEVGERVRAALERIQRRLPATVLHDSLTGLPDPTLFRERLRLALRRRRRASDTGCALLALDIDGFAFVNDSLGHPVGDELLTAFTRRVEEGVRAADGVARLGGDGLVVLLDDVEDAAQVVLVVERIGQALRRPFPVGGHEIFAAASIGITLGGGADGADADELLRQAETAMVRAKATGPGRYAFFDQELHDRVTRAVELEADLRLAIQRREFKIFYQPMIALGSGRLSGFEALLRWRSPTRGWVSPSDFIPVAEATGWIVALGHWVLRKACAQLAAWRSALVACRGLYVAVNVSARELAEPDLAADVREVLRQSGLPPGCLRLEVAERVLVDDLDAATQVLPQLEALEVHLSVDDFGTGGSSLPALHGLPFDTLKIDRSFIAELDADGDPGIVPAMITMARSLGLTTVAEGVETAEQATALRQLHCQLAQGFHYAKPMEAGAIWRLLLEHRRLEAAAWAAEPGADGGSESPPVTSVPVEISYPITVP